MFATVIKKHDEKLLKRGIEKGRQEGIEKGMIEVAIRGITGGYDNELINMISKLSFEKIDELRKIHEK